MSIFPFLVGVLMIPVLDAVYTGVDTNIGTFIGFTEVIETYEGKATVSKFLGIPYAESPIGELRFRKPVAKAPLKEPYKALEFGHPCVQIQLTFPASPSSTEDCLFLNIYKPVHAASQEALAVMVWIHGGGFLAGSADTYKGEVLAATGPVIVVTVNYRLGVFGFLNTEDAASPGNYGLWDQHLAIQWVHDNIREFGGDPDRVTIFGESAGGSAVNFQGLFPGNIGLFQRIIAQSGSALSPFALRFHPRRDAEHLAALVDCTDADNEAMVECLRGLPTNTITAAMNKLDSWDYMLPFPFIPSVDGDFIEYMPFDSFGDKRETESLRAFSSFDLMIGYNSGEGASSLDPFIAKIDTDGENFLPNKSYFDETLVPNLVKAEFGEDAASVIVDTLIASYTDWADPVDPLAIRRQYVNMLRDRMFAGSTARVLQEHAAAPGRRAYLYYFDLLTYHSVAPRPSWMVQPLHLDELMFVFGNRMFSLGHQRDLQHWERKASHDLMKLWTNFAKTGNPNSPHDIGVNWLPYSPGNKRYLEIANVVSSSKVKDRLHDKESVLWKTILPGIKNTASNCYKLYTNSCVKDSSVSP